MFIISTQLRIPHATQSAEEHPHPRTYKKPLRMGTAAAKSEEWSGLPRGQMQTTVLQ